MSKMSPCRTRPAARRGGANIITTGALISASVLISPAVAHARCWGLMRAVRLALRRWRWSRPRSNHHDARSSVQRGAAGVFDISLLKKAREARKRRAASRLVENGTLRAAHLGRRRTIAWPIRRRRTRSKLRDIVPLRRPLKRAAGVDERRGRLTHQPAEHRRHGYMGNQRGKISPAGSLTSELERVATTIGHRHRRVSRRKGGPVWCLPSKRALYFR